MKKLLKQILPNCILKLLGVAPTYGFFGNYATWPSAVTEATGYETTTILDKVLAASLKVQRGESAFERDGINFDAVQYSWPVTAMLLWAASRHNNTLEVLDFGGSLGSNYMQNRLPLKGLSHLRWIVVEQKSFVEAGRKHFQNDQLHFETSLDTALGQIKPHIFLASSVMQYIEKPFEILNEVVKKDFDCLVFDRTPFHHEHDIITVQKVAPRIYDASYPAWIFHSESFKTFLVKKGYTMMSETDQGAMSHDRKEGSVRLKNFIFIKKHV